MEYIRKKKKLQLKICNHLMVCSNLDPRSFVKVQGHCKNGKILVYAISFYEK